MKTALWANEVLNSIGWIDFTETTLYSDEKYLSVEIGHAAQLDGRFTADELEAISMWMRDPEAVTFAKEKEANRKMTDDRIAELETKLEKCLAVIRTARAEYLRENSDGETDCVTPFDAVLYDQSAPDDLEYDGDRP